MLSLRRTLLTAANRLGHVLPKGLQRRIADFPGVLRLMERLSRSEFQQVTTPEGAPLLINPLFHAYLAAHGLTDYEPDMRAAITRLAQPGMVAYDIGANVGIFSLLFASLVGPRGQVYAFEPEKNNYLCLRKTLELNPTLPIVLDKRAVGRAPGTEKFDRRGGAFSGRLLTETQHQATDNVETIETVSVDHLIAHEGYRPPDILKIDVEGNERLVLEGMATLLSQSSPTIICELHTHLGDPSERVIELLEGYGYKLTDIHGGPVSLEGAAQELHIVAAK